MSLYHVFIAYTDVRVVQVYDVSQLVFTASWIAVSPLQCGNETSLMYTQLSFDAGVKLTY